MNALLFYGLGSFTLFAACLVVSCRSPVHSAFALIMAFFTASGLFLILGAEFLALLLIVVYVGAVAIIFLFVVMMINVNQASLKQHGWPGFGPLFRHLAQLSFFLLMMGGLMGIAFWCDAISEQWLNILPAYEGLGFDWRQTLYSLFAVVTSVWLAVQGTRFVCQRSVRDILKESCAFFPLSILGMGLFAAVIGVSLFWQRTGGALDPQAKALTPNLMNLDGVSNIQQIGRVLYTEHVISFQGVGIILLTAMIGAICLCLRERPGVLRQKVHDQLRTSKEDVLVIHKVKSGEVGPWKSH